MCPPGEPETRRNLETSYDRVFLKAFLRPLSDLPFGIIAIDRDRIVRCFNSVAGYYLGMPPSLALGKSVDETMPHSRLSDILAGAAPQYDKQKIVNNRLIRSSLIPVTIGDDVRFALEFMVDQTERSATEKELARLKEKYDLLDMLLDTSFEELGAVDPEGKVTYMTQKSAHNLGVERDEVLGRSMRDLSPACLLPKVAGSGVPEFAHITRTRKKSVPVLVMPLIKAGVVQGAVCKSVFTDVDEAKKFARQLEGLDDSAPRSPRPRKRARCRFTFDDLVGSSKAIRTAKQRALRVAEGDSTILITGESGTGKELFAQAIHNASPRSQGPFTAVNCAGIPENLLESELFGYESGSFTGARRGGKPGKFELAHNGTLFLDEAGDMSMGMQAKLLRVTQEKAIERVGGTVSYEVDVRIIAATNKDLWEMVQTGRFREDLYYRLDVVNIVTPPLRDRIEDLTALIDHLLPHIRSRTGNSVRGVSERALELFRNYRWPGNVRELRNVLEGSMNLNTGDFIDVEDLPSRVRRRMEEGNSVEEPNVPVRNHLDTDLPSVERLMIERAIAAANGNKRQAAKMLKMSRATLYNKLKKYGIRTESSRS